MFILIIHEERWISTSSLIILKCINMGTKVYNEIPGYIKEIHSYKAFKKELKSFFFLHNFYSVKEFVSL
jgi:hypothetical protein